MATPATAAIRTDLHTDLDTMRAEGLFKAERVIDTKQGSRIQTGNGREVLNLCANNYLGLASHPDVQRAAHAALDRWGYGLASVRFICGTQGVHKQLEDRLTGFLSTEDTILYTSCFDANGGLFETLLTAQDAVVSDELNHASIIDGVRLCKAARFRYKNNDMADLRAKLTEARASGARRIMIATDGVFSMDGYLADLPSVCELADAFDALVMVDDSHAVGFMGPTGAGTPEHFGVSDRVDVITGTLGKALGGASGGYTSGRQEIIDTLRQRSRPYLFSNTVAPMIAGASITAIDLAEQSHELRQTLHTNTAYFRDSMSQAGFEVLPGAHPIAPVMLGDAALAAAFADKLLDRGVYVIGFSFPVVPRGKARIRTQVSAAHTQADLTFAVEQFQAVRDELGC